MSDAVYLLAGEEFLADEATDKIRAQVGTDPLSEIHLDGSVAPSEITTALETSSLLGGRRLVVVRRADELRKEHLTALESYLRSPSPDSVLVLIASQRGKLASLVKAAGSVIALEAPRGRRLVGWLRQRATAVHLKLDDRGAWALIDAVGTELRDLDAALEQMSTGLGAGARVSAAEVRRAFPRLSDERIYALTDAVGERKLAPAMATLRRLLDQGDEPLVLLGALAAHMRRLLVARRWADGGPSAVGAALGLPEWRAERLLRHVRSYREEELSAGLARLAEADVEMKGGDLSPELALSRAVVLMVGT